MTTSQPDVRRGAQTPRVANWPEYVSSAAPEVIDLATSAGLVLDPWQQVVLTHGLGEKPNGNWSATKVSTWVPRQNGKGAIIEARELAALFLFRERLILHSAHEYKTAQEAFIRIKSLIQNTPDLERRVNKFHEANGEQGIELTRAAGGSRLRFVARSKGSGRGFTGDLIILDEAQELVAAMMAAMLPTLSARPNHQMWLFGTPPDDPAAWVYGLREDGEAGTERLAHFDWGADVDLSDRRAVRRAIQDVDLWYSTNPALGTRIMHETVVDEAKPSGLGDLFVVERLGAWHPRASDGPSVLDIAAWEALTDETSAHAGDVALAVDIPPDRKSAVIVAYGPGLVVEDPEAAPLGHAEVIDRRTGTDWLVPRLVQLKAKWNPVAIGLDIKGPVGSLLTALDKAGIKVPDDPDEPRRGDLVIPTAQEVAASCGQLVDAVTQKTLRHPGQTEVTDAIRGAQTRPLGDAWAWGRKVSTADISPLVALTTARWAWEMRAHLVDENDYDVADSFG